MLIRIISAAVLLPLLIISVNKGGFILISFLCVASLSSLYELMRVISPSHKELNYFIYLNTAFSYVLMFLTDRYIDTVFLVSIAAILLMIKKRSDVIQTFWDIASYVYITGFLSHIYLLRGIDVRFCWLIFIIAFATDTFAYFSGLTFGKNKLVPSISPKKTIEGSIGGVLGAVLCSVIFAYFTGIESLIFIAVLAFLGSLVSQMGDLFASTIKRHYDIKDFSNIIPGHGGVIDRIDSVLLLAPFLYYMIILMDKLV